MSRILISNILLGVTIHIYIYSIYTTYIYYVHTTYILHVYIYTSYIIICKRKWIDDQLQFDARNTSEIFTMLLASVGSRKSCFPGNSMNEFKFKGNFTGTPYISWGKQIPYKNNISQLGWLSPINMEKKRKYSKAPTNVNTGFLSFKLFTLVDLGSLPESGDVICQQIATPMINSPTSNFDPSSLI